MEPMGIERLQYRGVLVRPGETLKCNPGELYCHVSQIALQDDKGNEDVSVFVKVDGNEILIGTLSVEKYPQCTIDLVFEKEFELLHTSKTSNISALGYKFRKCEIKSYADTSTDEDYESDEEVPLAIYESDEEVPLAIYESDEEVPLAIPLYPNADDNKSKETKSGAEKPAATEFCKPKSALEGTKHPEPLKDDIGGTEDGDSDEDYVDSEEGESGDDEDSGDKDDSESSDEDDGEDSRKNTMGKNGPAETPLKMTSSSPTRGPAPQRPISARLIQQKTPPEKKAEITTPSVGNKTGNGTTKRSGYVHVATPYPSSKQVKKTPSIIDSSKQSTGYSCKSCSKTFYSKAGLETHCKVKHNTHN